MSRKQWNEIAGTGSHFELRTEIEKRLEHDELSGTFLANGVVGQSIADTPDSAEETLPLAAGTDSTISDFGDYQLPEEIARGGMGVVCRVGPGRSA